MGAGYVGTVSHTVVNVATSSTLALVAEDTTSTVKYRCFQNDDASAYMYLGLGAAAELNKGICLAPKQAYEMSREAGNLWMGAVYAIHDGSGTKKLLVTQGR